MSNETHQGASFQNCANQLPLQGVCHSRKAHAHARQTAASVGQHGVARQFPSSPASRYVASDFLVTNGQVA